MIRKLWRVLLPWLLYAAFWATLGTILVVWLSARGF